MPSLQTIPKPVMKKDSKGRTTKEVKTPGLRDIFIPRPGNLIAKADFSQLELRVLAVLANDRPLLDSYESGADVHYLNAQDLFELDVVTKNQRQFAKVFAYSCVPFHSKALTRFGWRGYKDLVIGEEVLGYNQETGKKEWTRILEKFEYGSKPVYAMGLSRHFKFEATEDHRWFVKQRSRVKKKNGSLGWETRPYMVDQIRTTKEINTESSIVTNAPMTPDLKGLDETFTVEKFGVDWTERVCQMSSAQRRAFLQGFLLADGHVQSAKRTANPVWMWSQLNNEIFEGLLTASYLEHAGYIWAHEISARNMKSCRLSKKSYITGQKLQKTLVGEKPVWCIKTTLGSWVVRQKDCISITGNCNYGATPDQLWARMLVDFPGTRLDLIRNLVDRWFETHWAIAAWQKEQRLLAESLGYVEAPISKRRQYYHDKRINQNEIFNFPVQATGADIIDPAIIKISDQIDWNNYGILAQIHDEINLDGPDPVFMYDLLKKEMEWKVPLMGMEISFPIDVSIGTSWAMTKEFEGDKMRGLGPREELVDCWLRSKSRCDKVVKIKDDGTEVKCPFIGKDGMCKVLVPREE